MDLILRLFETHGVTATTVGNFNCIFGNCLNCIGATVAMIVIVFYGYIYMIVGYLHQRMVQQ